MSQQASPKRAAAHGTIERKSGPTRTMVMPAPRVTIAHVAGFDDLPQAAHSAPPLTTVRQPPHDMGRAATRALLSLIAGQALATEDIRLPAKLILRATTAAVSSAR